MYNYLKYIGLTKGVLTITDIISISENKKRVIVKCLCSKCGKYSEVRLDRFTISTPYATHYCEHCKNSYLLEKSKERYIGLTNGVLKCVDVIREGKQIKAVCECSRCKSMTTVRPDKLRYKLAPQSCNNCIKDLQREITTKRYVNFSGQKTIQEYKETQHDKLRITSIKNGAKEREIPFNLTWEKSIKLLHSNCYYCGKPHADGIDRIDSSKGYNIDNVVACCKICNIMKNKFPLNLFLEHVKLIYKKHCTDKSSSTIESTSNIDGSE